MKFYRIIRITLTVLLICSLFQISNAESLALATGEWEPFTSAKLDNYGEFTSRVNIVFKEMGIEPEYHFYPWNRCYESVVKGRVWAAFPYSYTKERASEVWFSDMLSCSKTVFFYYEQKESPKKYQFNALKDLLPYTIGGVHGYFYEESFKKAGLKVFYSYKEINAIENLKLGRVDLMPVNELVGWNLIKTHFPNDAHNFKTLLKPLNIVPLRLIISKEYPGSQKLMNRFNTALERSIEKKHITIEECN